MAKKTKNKVQSKDTSIYYDYNTVRSHNALLNFILTSRGLGKSFGAKLIIIKDWIKNKDQAVYVRRYVNELNDMKGKFFDDIMASEYFNEYEFKVVGDIGYIRKKETDNQEATEWSIIVHFIALSTSQKKKSSAYPYVNKIFYDEFIISNTAGHYLKNEPITFMELYSTIARLRPNVKAYFLANNVSMVNPYFSFFQNSSKEGNKLKINPEKRFNKSPNGLILVELYTKESYMEEFLKTPFGQLIDGTEYGEYAIENQSLMDNTAFIKDKRPKKCAFLCSFIIQGLELGVWYNYDNEDLQLYVDRVIEPSSKKRYTVSAEDHTPDFTQLMALRKSSVVNTVSNMRLMNRIFYNNVETESVFQTVFKYI